MILPEYRRQFFIVVQKFFVFLLPTFIFYLLFIILSIFPASPAGRHFPFSIFHLREAHAVPNDGTYYLQSSVNMGGSNASTPLSSTDTVGLCEAGGSGQCKVIRGSIGEIVGNRITTTDTASVCESGGNGLCVINPGWLYTRGKFYATSGNFSSKNLLSGVDASSVDTFTYTLNSLPSGTTATVQFSPNNGTSWYDSAGNGNGSNSLSVGNNSISLSALGWYSFFYYKVSFTGPGNKTPAFDRAGVQYTGSSGNLTPTFILYSTDGQNDYLKYKIQLCADAGMTANCQTFDQTASATGWIGMDAAGRTAYQSGSYAYYTVQSPFSEGTLYHWRAYTIDPGGANVWSPASSITSFTTSCPTACKYRLEGVQMEGIKLQ